MIQLARAVNSVLSLQSLKWPPTRYLASWLRNVLIKIVSGSLQSVTHIGCFQEILRMSLSSYVVQLNCRVFLSRFICVNSAGFLKLNNCGMFCWHRFRLAVSEDDRCGSPCQYGVRPPRPCGNIRSVESEFRYTVSWAGYLCV